MHACRLSRSLRLESWPLLLPQVGCCERRPCYNGLTGLLHWVGHLATIGGQPSYDGRKLCVARAGPCYHGRFGLLQRETCLATWSSAAAFLPAVVAALLQTHIDAAPVCDGCCYKHLQCCCCIDDAVSGSPSMVVADGGATPACIDGGGRAVKRPAASARRRFYRRHRIGDSGDAAMGTPATAVAAGVSAPMYTWWEEGAARAPCAGE
jgi:hypothetical protein